MDFAQILTNYQKIKFTLSEQTKRGNVIDKSFKGTIDPSFSRIKGKWRSDNEIEDGNFQAQFNFDFVIADQIPGTLIMKIENAKEQEIISREIELNFRKKEINPAKGQDK